MTSKRPILSDDESSDSSNEFLVPAHKIDLTSSFFEKNKKKSPQKKGNVSKKLADSSSDEDDFEECENTQVSSTELLAQVMKNLENAKNHNLTGDSTKSNDIAAGQSLSLTGENLKSKEELLSQEINSLLLQGESQPSTSQADSAEGDDAADTEEEAATEEKYSIPQEGVKIHLPGQSLVINNKGSRKKQDLQVILKNKINLRIRKTQNLCHKVGLLTWLSHGFHLNKIANDPGVLKTSLALVPKKSYPKGRMDLKYLEQFTKWFKGVFTIVELHESETIDKELLIKRAKDKKIRNYLEMVLLFIAAIRGLGVNCRLVISLQPPRLKPHPDQLFSLNGNENINSKQLPVKEESEVPSKKTEPKTISKKIAAAKKEVSKSRSSSKKEAPQKPISNSPEGVKASKLEARKKAYVVLNKLKDLKSCTKNSKKSQVEEKSSEADEDKTIKKSTRKVTSELKVDEDKTTKKSTKKVASESKVEVMDVDSDEDDEKKETPTIARKLRSRSKKTVPKEAKPSSDHFSTDDEYIEEKPKKRVVSKKIKTEAITVKDKSRKILSSEDEVDEMKNTFNYWVEVYLESEESWISVSLLDQKIHCVAEIYRKAAKPVLYVIAWNSANTIKDVTRRYCAHWLTDTRKKRVEEKWWSETLASWKERDTSISKAEDDQLLQHELEQPLPTTVSECKGHPLYALQRHLLKFEALYPPDAVPLGHLKTGEAIYSRHCVHTLYSRETWVKRARVVKPAQEPYKVVKSMPKYDKLSGMKIKDQPLELFGKWQTGPYIPPEAKDGKVPRNEYGNVDLFKMCMLPRGTVYIKLPALNRIARKLNIDCAPACVGFNFGCRGALPMFEGFVVCKEYEDTLREAWEEEQVLAQKRATEKREKRIYGNWRKLIKGLLIREKLVAKYKGEDAEEDQEEDEKSVKTVTTTKKSSTVKEAASTTKRTKKQNTRGSKKLKASK